MTENYVYRLFVATDSSYGLVDIPSLCAPHEEKTYNSVFIHGKDQMREDLSGNYSLDVTPYLTRLLYLLFFEEVSDVSI
jgi:hypothetical protein